MLFALGFPPLFSVHVILLVNNHVHRLLCEYVLSSHIKEKPPGATEGFPSYRITKGVIQFLLTICHNSLWCVLVHKDLISLYNSYNVHVV